MSPKQSCKTCRYLEVPLNGGGQRVAYQSKGYRCTAPEPPAPIVPASNLWFAEQWRRAMCRSLMAPRDGTDCPTWELYVKPTTEGNP